VERRSSLPIFCDPKWKFSAGSLPIELYASKPLSELKKTHPLLLIGGVHGDEPEGVELAKKTLLWLKSESYQKHKGSKPSWILIPCINPDGFSSNQRTNSQGIDLNRNFPTQNWSAEFSKDRYYPGTKPLESPEVQALVELIEEHSPPVIVHFHSWEPCIVVTGPENHPFGKALSECSGYPLKSDIGYPTPGSLGCFGWKEKSIPVICVEEQEHSDLSKVWDHFAEGIKEMLLTPIA
tara:strand:+ start:2202 stop:2912 length:711 start_codon:yes stop_codon:yes gene_type:complete